MSLAAGDLRHMIDIQQPTKTQDAVTGEVTVVWDAVHENVYCSIQPLSVKDFIQSAAMQTELTSRVTIRYISGLTKDMRFVGVCGCHVGEIFNPAGFLRDPDSGMEYITSPCSSGINEGDV